MVDGKLESLQWEENSTTKTSYDYSARCLNKRQEAYCKGVFIERDKIALPYLLKIGDTHNSQLLKTSKSI